MPRTPLEDHILGVITLYADDISTELRSRIELFPEGEYVHNQAGKMKIDEKFLQAFADDVNERGDRIPLDYDHSFGSGKGSLSAGWFVRGSAQVEENSRGGKSLFADVQWTPRAAESIKAGEYRFISPEWNTKWKDKTTGAVKKGARLFAAALTNRQFFDEMDPVVLCDEGIEALLANDDTTHGREAKKEETMSKAIAEALGLKADASEDEISAAIKKQTDDAVAAALEAAPKPDPVAPDATLVANAAAGAKAATELFELKRDTLLDKAIADRKIDPAQRDHFVSLYASNPAGVTGMLESIKAGTFEPIGSEGSGEGKPAASDSVLSTGAHDALYASNPPESVLVNGSPVDVDEQSREVHTAALELLKTSGKALTYTADEYLEASILAASEKGISL